MILTDTHTHLYSDAFDEDRNEVIERALNQGITRFFLPAIDSKTTKQMQNLKKSYPQNIFLMVGLHPTSVNKDFESELSYVESQLKSYDTYYAIGEIGIDLYWDDSLKDIQKEVFKKQIQLAKQYELPIVIHCRDAFDEVFEVLEFEKSDNLKGIFHCFMGNLEQAHQAVSYNMLLGIGGVVTFKNGKIDKFLNQIDLKHIVLETDAPYLAPTPHRGKRNESLYLIEIVKKLSSIYSISEEEIANITTRNSKLVFGI